MSIKKEATEKKVTFLAKAREVYGKSIILHPLKYDETKCVLIGRDNKIIHDKAVEKKLAKHLKNLACLYLYLNDIDLSDAEVLEQIAECNLIRLVQFTAAQKVPSKVFINEGLKRQIKLIV